MRVIAGKAKGIPLQSVPGSGTRPISDRVKEALFNILGAEIVGARVLDLFTWEAKARQVLDVYDWVLGKRDARPGIARPG